MPENNTIPPLERFYACLPYLLPMSAVVIFGDFLFQQVPFLVLIFLPFIWLYQNVLMFPVLPPLGLMGEFVIFLGLLFFMVRSDRFSRFVRFNAMQALLLEIVIFLVQLLMRFLVQGLRELPSLLLVVEVFTNTVFIGIIAACIYAIYQGAIGKYSEIPGISEAALMQSEY